MKILYLFLLVLFSNTVFAQHEEHDYMGSHGMVFFSSPGGELFAYHMPLYSKPHDYQLLYKLRAPQEVKQLLNKDGLLTLLPERFNLSKLINGDTLTLNADFYQGHFERGGTKVMSAKIEFVEQTYKRSLKSLSSDTKGSNFEYIKIDDESHLLIYRIEKRPSFDSLTWLPADKTTKLDRLFNCDEDLKAPKSSAEVDALVVNCLGSKPSYIEYLDFQ